MLSSNFKSLPKFLSKEFSGLQSEEIVEREEETVKEFLEKVCSYPETNFQATLSLMSPSTRLVSMKSLVALFDVVNYDHFVSAWGAIHTATKIMAEMAKLPSEVKDGIALIKTSAEKLSKFMQSTSSKTNVGDVLTEMAVALTGLLKKMEVFEISRARLGQEKTDALKFLVKMVVQHKIDAERSEKIRGCMKTISEGETRLQGILGSGKGIGGRMVSLLNKISEEFGEILEVETLLEHGSETLTYPIFYSKWNDIAHKLSPLPVDQEGDGICYIELLSHYLNAKTIRGQAADGDLRAYLFGKSKTGGDYVMLDIKLDGQEDHSVVKGHVYIRSNSQYLLAHALSKVDYLKKNPDLMNF